MCACVRVCVCVYVLYITSEKLIVTGEPQHYFIYS